jgi:hypothetical protein
VVKSYFRERPAMIRRRKTELAWLKRFEIPEHPLRAGAYAGLEPVMIRWRTTVLAGLRWASRKFSNLGMEA